MTEEDRNFFENIREISEVRGMILSLYMNDTISPLGELTNQILEKAQENLFSIVNRMIEKKFKE